MNKPNPTPNTYTVTINLSTIKEDDYCKAYNKINEILQVLEFQYGVKYQMKGEEKEYV